MVSEGKKRSCSFVLTANMKLDHYHLQAVSRQRGTQTLFVYTNIQQNSTMACVVAFNLTESRDNFVPKQHFTSFDPPVTFFSFSKI